MLLFSVFSHRFFGLLLATGVAVNVLGATNVQAQRAECPSIGYATVSMVSISRAQGPLAFLAGCTPVGSSCQSGSRGVSVNGVVPGVLEGNSAPRDLGGGQWLVFFTPTTPLGSRTHTVAIVGDSLSNTTFQLRPEYVGDPLSEITLVEEWVSTPSGDAFTCAAEGMYFGCKSTLSFQSNASLEPTLSIKGPSADGWLFSIVPAPWSINAKATTQVTAGIEHCFTVQGWNVLTDVKTSRQVCGTAAPRTEADRQVPQRELPLSDCQEPPYKAGTSERAEELMGEWCEKRKAICSADASETGCVELAKLCRAEDASDSPPDADAAVGDVKDDAGSMEAAPTSKADGCQLSQSSSHSWFGLVATVLAGLFVARRRWGSQ